MHVYFILPLLSTVAIHCDCTSHQVADVQIMDNFFPQKFLQAANVFLIYHEFYLFVSFF